MLDKVFHMGANVKAIVVIERNFHHKMLQGRHVVKFPEDAVDPRTQWFPISRE